MSPYVLKTALATALVAVGLVSFFSMMALQGRLEKKGDPARLRRIHRRVGLAFIILLVPLVFLGERFVRNGDGLRRAVFIWSWPSAWSAFSSPSLSSASSGRS
jgi:hypothetical protein